MARQARKIGESGYICTWTYTWAQGRQLRSMARPSDSYSLTFEYNEDGLIKFGIVDGEDGLYDVCPCCDDVPIGAAVFCFRTKSEGNDKFDKNEGWTHVGFYIGYGIVVEASIEENRVSISSIYDRKWDYYGLLRGICY